MQHKAVQAVLFDRDGVLTYFDVPAATSFFRLVVPISLFELAACWQSFGEAKGFPRSVTEERIFFTKFWNQLTDEFDLQAEQRAVLENLDYTRFIVPYPEVRSVLDQLQTHKIRLGVLSNFSLASLEQSLVSIDLAAYFDVICAATVIGASKPSALAYEIALEGLQVTPEHCLFLDDEAECVDAARRLGLRAYLIHRHGSTHDMQRGILANLLPVPQLALAI
jgi:HAD superfamily hydrolase (TIGR01509 family)